MSSKRVVLRSNVMGFCMGVKAVMQTVEKELCLEREQPFYTYGPLIHNRLVLEKLHEKGISEIKEPSEGKGGTLIIRAHGIHPAIRSEFQNAGYRIVDGTCPRVLNSQHTVSEYSDKGWYIIIVGDKKHGEVQAVAGCAKNYSVVLTEEDVLSLSLSDRTLVIAQTTLSTEEYDKICRILSEKNRNIKIIKSICPATRQRQISLTDLIAKVDAIVVIGGKNSANTRRLFVRAKNSGKPSWQVEDVSDLPAEIKDFNRIGITAGASTPDWIIEDIETALLKM